MLSNMQIAFNANKMTAARCPYRRTLQIKAGTNDFVSESTLLDHPGLAPLGVIIVEFGNSLF